MLYNELILSGRLHTVVADLNAQAADRLDLIIRQMMKAEGVTEAMKAENQMLWAVSYTHLDVYKRQGYVVRVQSRDERGRMSRNKYTVYALPQKEKPSPDLPSSENPTTVKPPPDEPMTEKPTQINTNQVIPKKRNDSLSKYQSINPDGMDAMDERERYEEIIRENLEVDILSQDSRYDIDRVNEIIEVMLDAICSTSPTLRVNNTDMPKEVVKSRLLKLNSSHIDYVFDAMRKSPSDIRNIRAYMLTALYNAPATIDNYYSALVNHDLYGDQGTKGW